MAQDHTILLNIVIRISYYSVLVPELQKTNSKVPHILVGCKSDLRHDGHLIKRLQEKQISPVTLQEAQEAAKKFGSLCYCECSAQDNTGIDALFHTMMSQLADEAWRLVGPPPLLPPKPSCPIDLTVVNESNLHLCHQTLIKYYSNQEFSDVTLVVNNSPTPLPAHKIILSSCCSSLAKILKETPTQQDTPIRVDMSTEEIYDIHGPKIKPDPHQGGGLALDRFCSAYESSITQHLADGLYSDITIRTQDGSLSAHKVYLKACGLFEAFILDPQNQLDGDNTNQTTCIPLDNLTTKQFHDYIIAFLYGLPVLFSPSIFKCY